MKAIIEFEIEDLDNEEDITIGLIITISIMIVVFPFNFIYERLKVAYYEIKEQII